MTRRALRSLASIALALVAASSPLRAGAEGVSAQIEPSFTAATIDSTPEGGATTETRTTELRQLYRLAYDRRILPLLAVDAAGLYEWRLGTTRSDVTSDLDGRRWNVAGRLLLGDRLLNGSVAYSRSTDSQEIRTRGVGTFSAPERVRELIAATGTWTPAELPSLELRLARSNNFDSEGLLFDVTTDEATLTAGYREIRNLDLRYTGRAAQQLNRPVVSRPSTIETRELVNLGRAEWTDALMGRRVTYALSYALSNRISETSTSGAGGEVATQVVPLAGYSAIEPITAAPELITLARNPALVDGNTGTSAGLDLGFQTGDTAPRDLGAELGPDLPAIDRIDVWVDRTLPAGVWTRYRWRVFRSDDNETWVEVLPLSGAVQFGLFENRFEIPIPETRARFVKVVVAPLAPGVTVDPAFAHVFVTELQLFQLDDAAALASRGSLSTTNGNLNATARALLYRPVDLAYDFGFFLVHRTSPTTASWSVLNGLSGRRRLVRWLSAAARLDRTDTDQVGGRIAQTRGSASLSANPLATLGATLTYGAQVTESEEGTGFGNSVALAARADLYEGIDVGGVASYNVSTTPADITTRSGNVSASTSLVPHRTTRVTAAYSLSTTDTSLGANDRRTSLDGTVAFNPFPAISLSAGATRLTSLRAPPTTLANFGANLSPFQGGALVLSFSYSDSLDTGSDERNRIYGPSLRWAIRPGVFLNGAYTRTDARSPALDTTSRVVFGSLVIALK